MEEEKKEVEKKVEAQPEGTKSKKLAKTIIKVVLIVVVVALVLVLLINAMVRSPKEVTKSFFNKLIDAKTEKAFKYVDLTGYYVAKKYVYEGGDLEDYEDFWEDYQDALDDSDVEDYVSEFEDYIEENAEDFDDEMEDEDYTIKIKKIKSVDKISSHFYEVKMVAEYSEDDDEYSSTITVYVVKKGLKSYVVYFSGIDSYVGFSVSALKTELYNALYDY